MVGTTQLMPTGIPGRRYGSFAGKANTNQIPAVIYDGIQGYMLHTGGPAGAADGAALSFAWAGTFNSDGSAMTLLDIPGTVPVKITRQSDNTIDFVGGTAGAVFSNSTAAVAASVGFCIVLASCNGTASHLYVIHAAGLITGTNTAGSATNLDLTADWYLGADGGAAEFLDADTALWWADDSFIDFSDSDNREQFWDTTNDLLRDPGSDGSNPTDGTQPLVCHKNAAATHTTNVGSGGDADTAGVFTDGTSPGTYAEDYVPGAPVDISFVTSGSSGTNGSSYDFNGVSLGTEDASRRIVIVGYTAASSNLDWDATLDSAAADYDSGWFKSPTGLGQVGIFVFDKPTGTTGNINLSGGFASRAAYAVFRLTNAASATPSDVDTASGTSLGTTITIPDNGAALAAVSGESSVDVAYTGVTERVDSLIESCDYSAGSDNFASGGDTLITPSTGAVDAMAIFAAWTPAA